MKNLTGCQNVTAIQCHSIILQTPLNSRLGVNHDVKVSQVLPVEGDYNFLLIRLTVPIQN